MTTVNGDDGVSDATSVQPDDPLEALALAELLEESRRAQNRTSTMGALGWAKPPPQTNINKTFLTNTLVSTRRDVKPPKTPPNERRQRDNKRSPSPLLPLPGSRLKLDESLEKEKKRVQDEEEKKIK